MVCPRQTQYQIHSCTFSAFMFGTAFDAFASVQYKQRNGNQPNVLECVQRTKPSHWSISSAISQSGTLLINMNDQNLSSSIDCVLCRHFHNNKNRWGRELILLQSNYMIDLSTVLKAGSLCLLQFCPECKISKS